MSRNPIERALGVWSTANYRDVMLPGLGAVTCGQFCDAMADESLSRTGAVKVKRLIAELEQMTESDRTHLREVASDEIKAILSALEPAAPEGRQEAVAWHIEWQFKPSRPDVKYPGGGSKVSQAAILSRAAVSRSTITAPAR